VTLALRPGRVVDIFRLQEIERAAAELFRDSGLIDVSKMSVITMGDHIGSIDEGLSIVAEMEGRVVGFAMGEMHDENAYLRELDVDPVFQKRGAGAALVKAFAEAARARHATAAYLSTFRAPRWNAPFYRKQGFRDVARTDYMPWMQAIEYEQSKFLDIDTRVFMRLKL